MAPSKFELVFPLCLASGTAALSVYQYPLFYSFLQARPSIAGRPLSGFWNSFSPGGAIRLATDATTAISAALAWRSLSYLRNPNAKIGSLWYLYGAAFAATHLLFAPIVAKPINRMASGAGDPQHDKAIDEPLDWAAEQSIEEQNRREQSYWLKIHTVRTFVADLPALFCLSMGVGYALDA